MAVRDEIAEAEAAFERGDHALARNLVQPLADAGDAHAQTVLGTWCMTAWGLFVDAERWLLLAADAGSGHAAHNLGVLYSTGWPDRKPDKTRARFYLQRAVDSGFGSA